MTVRGTFLDAPFAVARIDRLTALEAARNVVTVNVPLLEPAGMTMLLTVGCAIAVLLLASVTVVDTAGAASRVTVPVTDVPARTELALRVRAEIRGGRTVTGAETDAPL